MRFRSHFRTLNQAALSTKELFTGACCTRPWGKDDIRRNAREFCFGLLLCKGPASNSVFSNVNLGKNLWVSAINVFFLSFPFPSLSCLCLPFPCPSFSFSFLFLTSVSFLEPLSLRTSKPPRRPRRDTRSAYNFLRSLAEGFPLRYKPGDSSGKFPSRV